MPVLQCIQLLHMPVSVPMRTEVATQSTWPDLVDCFSNLSITGGMMICVAAVVRNETTRAVILLSGAG